MAGKNHTQARGDEGGQIHRSRPFPSLESKVPRQQQYEHFSLCSTCLVQKTREGCGCFRLFGGSRGKLREGPGKIAGEIFPNRAMLRILGFQAPGKANLPGTLGRHCPRPCTHLPCGVFLESTVPAFSSFSDCFARFRIWCREFGLFWAVVGLF